MPDPCIRCSWALSHVFSPRVSNFGHLAILPSALYYGVIVDGRWRADCSTRWRGGRLLSVGVTAMCVHIMHAECRGRQSQRATFVDVHWGLICQTCPSVPCCSTVQRSATPGDPPLPAVADFLSGPDRERGRLEGVIAYYPSGLHDQKYRSAILHASERTSRIAVCKIGFRQWSDRRLSSPK